MSKKEKLIKKFTTVPAKSALTFDELETLLCLRAWDIKKLKEAGRE